MLLLRYVGQYSTGPSSLLFQRLPHKQAVGGSNPDFLELGL